MKIRIGTIILFMLCCFSTYAQVSSKSTIELDLFIKIVLALFTVGGFFLTYAQVRMANKLQTAEAGILSKMHEEVSKLEAKIGASGKEIEAKMATRHDIDQLGTIIKLYHDLEIEKEKNIEYRLNRLEKN